MTTAINTTLQEHPYINEYDINICSSCNGEGEPRPDIICKNCNGTGISNYEDLIGDIRQWNNEPNNFTNLLVWSNHNVNSASQLIWPGVNSFCLQVVTKNGVKLVELGDYIVKLPDGSLQTIQATK